MMVKSYDDSKLNMDFALDRIKQTHPQSPLKKAVQAIQNYKLSININ